MLCTVGLNFLLDKHVVLGVHGKYQPIQTILTLRRALLVLQRAQTAVDLTVRLQLAVGRGLGTPDYHFQLPDPFRIVNRPPPASHLAHLDVSQVTDFKLLVHSRRKTASTARYFCNAADRFAVLGTFCTRGCQTWAQTQRTAHPTAVLYRPPAPQTIEYQQTIATATATATCVLGLPCCVPITALRLVET